MEQDLFAPGLRKIGAFEAAAVLAAPNSLLIHNTGDNFSTDWIASTYAWRRKRTRCDAPKILDAAAQADSIAQLSWGFGC